MHAKTLILPIKYLKRLIIRKEIILVYTLGKVGSSTVTKTLKTFSPKKIILQPHFLSQHYLTKVLPNTIHYNNNIKVAKNVFKTLNTFPNKNIKIITLVREPIGRDISNIFQNPKDFVDDKSILNISVHDLIKIYKEKENHEYTLKWFDDEFYHYTNTNIYEQPFNNENKYFQFKTTQSIDVLVIKMEYLTEVGPIALSDFLKVKIPCLVNSNTGAKKETSILQKNFVREYKPTEEEITKVYNSEYMNFFYSENEIQNFKNKWIKQK